jgi:hypothetical protein
MNRSSDFDLVYAVRRVRRRLASATTNSAAPQHLRARAASPLTGFEKGSPIHPQRAIHVRLGLLTQRRQAARSDDSAFLRTNAPQVVDWVTTMKAEGDRGTNFNLEEGNLERSRNDTSPRTTQELAQMNANKR